MASKVKVIISPGKRLTRKVNGVSRQGRTPRSQPVGEAFRLLRRSRLEQQLKEGYKQMAIEDRTTAELHLAAGWEVLR